MGKQAMSTGASVQLSISLVVQRFDNGFHIFSTEWGPYELVYLLDGVEYGSINLAYLGATDQWEMNQPINFILSSGIGGNGGTPNGVGFPSNMVINYVNYSQWSAGRPAPVTGLTATCDEQQCSHTSLDGKHNQRHNLRHLCQHHTGALPIRRRPLLLSRLLKLRLSTQACNQHNLLLHGGCGEFWR